MLDAIVIILIEIGFLNPRFGKDKKDITAGNRLFRFLIFVVVPIWILWSIFSAYYGIA